MPASLQETQNIATKFEEIVIAKSAFMRNCTSMRAHHLPVEPAWRRVPGAFGSAPQHFAGISRAGLQ
jgi:hypothetical protein